MPLPPYLRTAISLGGFSVAARCSRLSVSACEAGNLSWQRFFRTFRRQSPTGLLFPGRGFCGQCRDHPAHAERWAADALCGLDAGRAAALTA